MILERIDLEQARQLKDGTRVLITSDTAIYEVGTVIVVKEDDGTIKTGDRIIRYDAWGYDNFNCEFDSSYFKEIYIIKGDN